MRLLRHFWHKKFSDSRERRLVYQVPKNESGPESNLEGMEVNDEVRLKSLMSTANFELGNAARNDIDHKKIYQNQEDRLVLLASLKYDIEQGTIQVFDKDMMKLLDKDELTASELKELQTHVNEIRSSTRGYFQNIKDYTEEPAGRKYEDPDDEFRNSDLLSVKVKKYARDKVRSATPAMETAVDTLEKIGKDAEIKAERQGILLDLAFLFVRSTEHNTNRATLQDRMNAFFGKIKLTDELQKKEHLIPGGPAAAGDSLKTQLDRAVAALPAGATDYLNETQAKKIIEVIMTFGRISPSDADLSSVREAHFDARRLMPAELAAKKRFHFKKMEDRELFFYKMAGADIDDLISESRRIDGAIDFKTMAVYLNAQLQRDPDIKESDLSTKAEITTANLKNEEIKKIATKTGISEANLKTLTVSILKKGVYSIKAAEVADFLVAGKEYEALVYLYGSEIAEEVYNSPDAASVTKLDDRKNYLKSEFAYAQLKGNGTKELQDMWNRDKFVTYLEDEVGYKNAAGFKLEDTVLESSFPPKFSKYIIDDLEFGGEIEVGTVYALARTGIETKEISEPQARKIVEYIITDEKEGTVSRSRLLQIVGLLIGKKPTAAIGSVKKQAQDKIDADLLGVVLTDVSRNYRLKDSDQKEELIDWFTKLDDVSDDAAKYLKETRTSGLADREWTEDVKITVKKLYQISEGAAADWWKYMKDLRKLVYDPEGDEKLRKILDRREALSSMQSGFQDVLDSMKDAKTGGLEVQVANLWLDSKNRVQLREDGAKGYAANDTNNLNKALALKLKNYALDLKSLNPLLAGVRDVNTKHAAKLIVLHTRNLNLAQQYIDAAAAGRGDLFIDTHPDLKDVIPRDLAQIKRQEQYEGRDILQEAMNDLNVDMQHGALSVLFKEGYLAGEKHFSNWIKDPVKSEAGAQLDLVLYNTNEAAIKARKQPDLKALLIRVFTTGTAEKYKIRKFDAAGRVVKETEVEMTKADANRYVSLFQKNLEFKQFDHGNSNRQLDRENRFTEPIDIVRQGFESLSDMLHSGDALQQGIAIAIIFFGAKALWDGYNKGGISKAIVMGVPLMLGADIIVKDMSGKGVFERMGLTWMNETDLGSSVEQFLREQGNKEIYGEIDSDAGFAAMKTMRNVDMKSLIEWRQESRGSGKEINVSNDKTPDALKNAAYNLAVAELGSMSLNNVQPDQYERLGLEFMHKTLEAFFQDVAERNGGGTVDDGMDIVNKRYVTFESPELLATGFAGHMLDYTKEFGAFTMLDVLVYERPTPAMREHLLKNDSLLGWLIRKTDLTLEQAKHMIDKGVSLFNIVWGVAKREIPEMASKVYDATIDIWEEAYDMAHIKGIGAWEELSRDAQVAWAAFFRMSKAMGIKIKKMGEGVLESSYDVTAAVVEATPEAVRDLYISMLTLQGIGNAQQHAENLITSVFPGSIADLIVMEETVDDDPEKVDELADRIEWYKRLSSQLEAAIKPVPTEPQVRGWLVQGCDELGISIGTGTVIEKIDNFDELPSYQRMAVYEHVKRRIYSRVIAERIAFLADGANKEEYPIDMATPWNDPLPATGREIELTEGTYAHELNATYGLGTLEFLGIETTFAGMLNDIAESSDPGALKTVLGFLHWSIDWATRDTSTEYIKGHPRDNARAAINQISIFLHPFIEEAQIEFAASPEKLEAYRSFLQTLVTNAIVEVALGGLELEKQKGVSSPAENPFLMTKTRAQHALEYLKLLRGSSAKADKLAKLDLSVFTSSNTLPPLLKELRSDKEKLARITGRSLADLEREEKERKDSPLAPKTLDKAKIGAIDALIKKPGALGKSDREKLLDGLAASNLDAAKKAEIRSRFKKDFDAVGAPDLNKEEDRARDCDYLRGLASPADRLEVKKRLAKHYESLGVGEGADELLEMAKIRDADTTSNGRNRLQEVLNASASKILGKILPDMAALPIDTLKKEGDEYKDWKDQLTKLYACCSSPADHFADTVSDALEYVLYRGDVKKEEEWDGKKVNKMAKYKAYLEDAGKRVLGLKRTLTPPEKSRYRHKGFYFDDIPVIGSWTANKGSQDRMSSSPWSIDEGYVESIQKRLGYETEVHTDLFK